MISEMTPIEKLERDSGDLVHWLEDSGRRKHDAEWVSSLYAEKPHKPSSVAGSHPDHGVRIAQPGLLCLFAIAALTYATYYFLEVELTIALLPAIVVFIALF